MSTLNNKGNGEVSLDGYGEKKWKQFAVTMQESMKEVLGISKPKKSWTNKKTISSAGKCRASCYKTEHIKQRAEVTQSPRIDKQMTGRKWWILWKSRLRHTTSVSRTNYLIIFFALQRLQWTISVWTFLQVFCIRKPFCVKNCINGKQGLLRLFWGKLYIKNIFQRNTI